MSDKEVFKTMRDVIDALEEEFDDLDLELDGGKFVNLYSALQSLTGLLQDCTSSKKQTVSVASDVKRRLREGAEDIAGLASMFDATGDEFLQKQAEALDEILLTIGASKREVAEAKKAQDREIERIKASASKEESEGEDPYKLVKKQHDKELKVDETRREIADKVKSYRPLEAPLKTRTCPDHPGAQMSRIRDNTYQCSLDKSVYNYEAGFTTMKGNKIPGTSVENQSQDFDKPNEFTSFETRESRLNK